MKNIFIFFFLLFNILINAQKSKINLSLNDTNNQKMLNNYIKTENLCNKLNFVEKNISEFISINSSYKNLDKILEDISLNSNYEVEIILAYGKVWTTIDQRKEKLLGDISQIRHNCNCLKN